MLSQNQDLNDEDESSRGRRSGRSKQKTTESPPTEGGRSKRRRGDLDDDIELQFSVVGLGDLLNGELLVKIYIIDAITFGRLYDI